MKLRILVAALAALAAAPAFSQALGTVTSLDGVATVTSGGSVATLAKGAQVMHGSRIVTTSASSVGLALNSGCAVTVPPAHGVTVLSTMTCQQLQAAVQPVGTVASAPATAVMGQGRASPLSNVPVFVWGLAIGLTVAYDATHDDEPPLSGR